jgi:hypothetical protein
MIEITYKVIKSQYSNKAFEIQRNQFRKNPKKPIKPLTKFEIAEKISILNNISIEEVKNNFSKEIDATYKNLVIDTLGDRWEHTIGDNMIYISELIPDSSLSKAEFLEDKNYFYEPNKFFFFPKDRKILIYLDVERGIQGSYHHHFANDSLKNPNTILSQFVSDKSKKYLIELEEFLLKEKCIKFNLSYNDNIIETITMDIKKYKTKVPDNFYDLSLIGVETEYNHPHYANYGIEQAESKLINGLEVVRGGLTHIFTYY